MLDDIYTLCRGRGLHTPGANPKGALGARLKRHGKLENLVFWQGYGWWPAKPTTPAPGGHVANSLLLKAMGAEH